MSKGILTIDRELPKDWEVVKLGDILSLEYGKGLPENKRLEGKFPVYGSNGIVGCHEQFLVKGPGIVVGRKGTIGAVTWVDSDFWPIDTTYFVKTKNENVFLKWLFFKLKQSNLPRLSQSDVVPGLKRELVYHITIPLPPLPEQRRIAEVLGTVDSAIQKVGGAIESTERLKKGLMQRLLTRGIGHERFKFSKELDCEIPVEWGIIKVGKICQGIVPGRNKPKKFDGEIPWITQPDIDTMYIASSKSGLKVSKEEVKKSGGKIIPSNSVIMSCVGKFGIIAITRNDIVMNQQLHAFVCPDILDPYFLAIFLKSRTEYMFSIAAATTVPYLNKDKCNSIPIILPPLAEQRRIAEILNAVDRKLELERRRKEKLDRVKKGLMNELLTGRKRVKAEE